MSEINEAIGRNLQGLRYQRELSQQDLANVLGVDRTNVSRIEQGTRPLTASELVRLAEFFDVEVSELLKTLPTDALAIGSKLMLRSGPAGLDDAPQLNWFGSLCEHLPALHPTVSDATLRAKFRQLPTSHTGELAARRARSVLGLSQEEPVKGLSLCAQRLGGAVVGARLPSKSRLSGCFLRTASVSAILVNMNHPPPRRRFTLAHEIGHYLLDSATMTHLCDAGEVRRGPRGKGELRADVFASAFLVPKKAAVSVFGKGLPSIERIASFQDEFGVSRPALLARLRALFLVPYSDARVLHKVLPTASTSVGSVPPFRVIGRSINAGLTADVKGLNCAVVPDDEVIP